MRRPPDSCVLQNYLQKLNSINSTNMWMDSIDEFNGIYSADIASA